MLTVVPDIKFWKAFSKMNFYKFVLPMVTMLAVTSAKRIRAKGNMRGTVIFASGLSPDKAKIFKLMVKQRNLRRYGRF